MQRGCSSASTYNVIDKEAAHNMRHPANSQIGVVAAVSCCWAWVHSFDSGCSNPHLIEVKCENQCLLRLTFKKTQVAEINWKLCTTVCHMAWVLLWELKRSGLIKPPAKTTLTFRRCTMATVAFAQWNGDHHGSHSSANQSRSLNNS